MAAGSIAIVSVKLNHMARDKGTINMLLGFILYGAGIYFLVKGKRQQVDERKDQNN